MKETLNFLSELKANNNREWFEANKPRYKKIQADFHALAGQLIDGISGFDPSIAGLAVKDCTYRIYRDVRFSNDKSPYKTHIGAYFCPGGKKSGYSGYYLHIEPAGEGLLGGNFITAGLYMAEGKVIKSVRDEIFDNSEGFLAAIAKAKGFEVDMTNSLKRTPVGYPAGSPMGRYLRLKDVYLSQPISLAFLEGPGLAARVTAEFRKTYDFNVLLNRAVQYAHEEM